MSISPNVPTPQESYHYESAAGTPRWIIVLFGLLFAALAALAYTGYTAQNRLQQDLAKQQEQNKILSAELEQANARFAELKGHVEVTEQKVGMTQSEIAQAKSRAEAIRKEQQASDQKLAAQLSDVQKASDEKIGAVATDLGGAKEDLEEPKRRGERNYYEFTLTKTKTPQRVGPIQLNLTKTDAKKSRYTMNVFADDRQIEKKDRTAGEPVQFYVGNSRIAPYEIVVFNVGKNQVTGYLSTPKEGAAPAAPPAAAPAAGAPAKPGL